MLPKAHLISHSRMFGSRWVIWVIQTFLYRCPVYSCHLFLISFPPVRSVLFLSFIVPIFAWNIPLIFLIFLKKSLVSLYHFIVFLYFFELFTWEGFLISPCYSLELCFQMGISFFSSFAFHFSSFLAICWGLLWQPFCPFAFLFLWNCFDHHFLYNVMNLCP